MAEEPKKQEDFTSLLDTELPRVVAQAQSGDLNGALEKLLALEKKTRLGADSASTARVAVEIVRRCWEARNLEQLNAHVLIVAKRRSQLKQAIADMVKEAMGYVDAITNKDDKVTLVTTLRTVTDGKIYVEVERARLTMTLSKIREAEGKVAEASEILQEVAVETFGSMEKREKAEFLLEQVRLVLAQRDFVKAGILAAKMNKKVLDEAGFEDVRLRHYELLVGLHTARHDALELCKDYQAVYATRGLAAEPAKWQPALASVIVYLALSPFSNEVSDLLHRVLGDPRTEETPLAPFRALLTYLTTDELAPWPLPPAVADGVKAHPAFRVWPGTGTVSPTPIEAFDRSNPASGVPAAAVSAASSGAGVSGTRGGVASAVVGKEDEPRCPWWPMLHKRLVQHNIRVVAKAYTRITTGRLAGLLGLDAPTTEAALSELVSDKALWAKIDRPAGVVVFAPPQLAAEVLRAWAGDIDGVLAQLETATHLINKEAMVRGVTLVPQPVSAAAVGPSASATAQLQL